SAARPSGSRGSGGSAEFMITRLVCGTGETRPARPRTPGAPRPGPGRPARMVVRPAAPRAVRSAPAPPQDQDRAAKHGARSRRDRRPAAPHRLALDHLARCELTLAQLPGHLGGLVLDAGGPGPGPRLHVGPGGEFVHGLAETIPGAFDLKLNFWRGHRCILPQKFRISSISAFP